MKLTLVVFGLLATLVLTEGFGWGPGCRKDSDCEEDECCVRYHMWYGRCMDRGAEGDICVPKTKYNSFHKAMCPCQKGLECVAGPKQKFPHMEFVEKPTCQKKKETKKDTEDEE